MSTYRLYQKARDAAWRALLQLPDKKLPVDVEALAQAVGAEIHPFPDPGEEARLSALIEKCGKDGSGRKNAAVSLRIQVKWHIFMRPGLDDAQFRFAAAHELGHLILEDATAALSPGVRRFESLENEGDLMENPADLSDYAADIFAIRLLAPACVLHELHIDTPGGIAALCCMPPKAAAFRAERMQLLNRRNAFYTRALERQVLAQFRPFLNGYLVPAPIGRVPLVLPDRKITGNTKLPENVPAQARPAANRPQPRRRFYLPRWVKYALAAVLALAVIIVCRFLWG